MAPIVEWGDGCRLWDIDGNEYIEYGIGLRSVTLGHNFRPVVDAVARHLALGQNFVRPHRLELVAAERLIELIPSAEMVKFGLNGSDATSAAVRLARAYTGRDLVAVCAEQPFFSTDDWFIGRTEMNAGIPEGSRDLTVAFHYNDLAGIEALFDEHPDRIAAVILEPETIEPPAPGFFSGLRRLCDRHGVVLILDEIITGFRWHERGAQYVYAIEPDLCAFGKGLANGFPVSALAGRRELMRLGGFAQDRDRVFLLSQTYGGEPWAMAAVLASIDVYESHGVTDRLHRAGSRLRAGIETVVAREGLADHIQLLGRDCNLVYAARDASGERSQVFRTILMQELIRNGVLAPSFVVSFARRRQCDRPDRRRRRGRDAGIPARARGRSRGGARGSSGPTRGAAPGLTPRLTTARLHSRRGSGTLSRATASGRGTSAHDGHGRSGHVRVRPVRPAFLGRPLPVVPGHAPRASRVPRRQSRLLHDQSLRRHRARDVGLAHVLLGARRARRHRQQPAPARTCSTWTRRATTSSARCCRVCSHRRASPVSSPSCASWRAGSSSSSASDGAADVTTQYAQVIPSTVVGELMGLNRADREKFLEWNLATVGSQDFVGPEALQAYGEMDAYWRATIAVAARCSAPTTSSARSSTHRSRAARTSPTRRSTASAR